MDHIVELKNLTKIFRIGKVDVPALRGVDLQVERGEFLAIMGPSGCGKSTMLHIMGGLLGPTSGDVILDRLNISERSDRERTEIRKQKIGFVLWRMPSTVWSFRLIRFTATSPGSESGATAKPWFWAVISTRPVSRSFTG